MEDFGSVKFPDFFTPKLNRLMKKIIIPFLIYSTIMAGEPSLTKRGVVEDFTQLKYKVATATRTKTPPVIDGIINDEEWEQALLIEEFLQHEPYNLELPSVKTVARILYDDNYLYVSFLNFDSNPEKIMATRGRRDDWELFFQGNSDWVGFGFDSNNDDKTGNYFAVNAAGIQLDIAVSGQDHRGWDRTWNAVWDSEVSINKNGWSAEIRIPFSALQYSNEKNQTWGVSFQRGIFALQEETHWPGRYKGVRGIIPHFGILRGINNIPQSRNIELTPYVLGGQTKDNEKQMTQNLGLDMRYNLNTNTTINMTFNPDFGQVQTDPSVLNLSAFETRLEERRPFFVQGGNFFRNRLRTFNSRRIGSRPGFFDPDSGSIKDRPENTAILAAAKLLGETDSGIKYGIINAFTNQEYATNSYEVNGITENRKFLVEPYTNYFIGRFEKSLINDLSTIGIMATDLSRKGLSEEARSFNLDWSLNLLENKFSFEGEAANSMNNGSSGYASRFSMGYRDPIWWDIRFWGGYKDEKFDVSKMGYQDKNNNWYGGIRGAIRRDTPKGIFLDQQLELKYNYGGRFADDRGDAVITRNNVELEQRNNFKNYWALGWSASYSAEVFEDDDIYRDSRAVIIKDNEWKSFNFWVQTDRRKRMILRSRFDIDKGSLRGWGRSLGFELTLKPTDYINLSIESSEEYKPVAMQWVGIIEDGNKTNIIYSNSIRKQRNIEVRMNVALSPKMTFESYYQPFKARMEYHDYGRLKKEKSFDLEPYEYGYDKDFEIDNEVGTFVFRWEYLPGSLIYVVYNLNINNKYSDEEKEWERFQSNSLFIKVDRFFRL